MAATVDAKLLKSTKFPPEFNQKVDMQKVNLQVMKKSDPFAPCPRFSKHADLLQDGSRVEYPTYWATRTTLSSSFASI